MIIPQGKHKGETTEMVFFLDPYYVKRMYYSIYLGKKMPEIEGDFIRLIRLFNGKKFRNECDNCSKPAIAMIYFKGTLIHKSWCYDCNHIFMKKMRGKLEVFTDYISAIEFVDEFCEGKISYYGIKIREMAVLKGLPKVFGKKEALEFFVRCEKEYEEERYYMDHEDEED